MDAPNCIGQYVDEKVFHSAVLQEKPEAMTENEEGIFGSIKKTIKELFTSAPEPKLEPGN